MHNFPAGYALAVINNRIKILLASLLLVVISIAVIVAKPLGYNNSNEMWFLPGDPNLVSFEKLQDLFGDSEYLVVGISARDQDRDVFELDTLIMIDEISTMLEDHEVVTQVRSLSKYQRTYNKNGMVATDNLIEDFDDIKTDPDLINSAREIMKGEELALDSIITKDFKDTRIMARAEYRANDNAHKVKVVTDLKNFMTEKGYEKNGYNIRLGGVPLVGERFETLSNTDFGWIVPLMSFVMFCILGLMFRSIVGMIVP